MKRGLVQIRIFQIGHLSKRREDGRTCMLRMNRTVRLLLLANLLRLQ